MLAKFGQDDGDIFQIQSFSFNLGYNSLLDFSPLANCKF